MRPGASRQRTLTSTPIAASGPSELRFVYTPCQSPLGWSPKSGRTQTRIKLAATAAPATAARTAVASGVSSLAIPQASRAIPT